MCPHLAGESMGVNRVNASLSVALVYLCPYVGDLNSSFGAPDQIKLKLVCLDTETSSNIETLQVASGAIIYSKT